jgi:hypothetical protein
MDTLMERIPPENDKDSCQRTVIEDHGGIGKSQLAIEDAYRVKDAYPTCAVFWVPAVSLVAFENAYREIGKTLGIQGLDEPNADVKTLVKFRLSSNGNNWLMILDNADDKSLVCPQNGTWYVTLPVGNQRLMHHGVSQGLS